MGRRSTGGEVEYRWGGKWGGGVQVGRWTTGGEVSGEAEYRWGGTVREGVQLGNISAFNNKERL